MTINDTIPNNIPTTALDAPNSDPELQKPSSPPATDQQLDVSESSVLHRTLLAPPHAVASAKGAYLTLTSGRRVLDACGGAAVACIGHAHPEILEAVTAQMQSVSYVSTMAYGTESAEALAKVLIDEQGRKWGLEKAYFVGSGSEAMDAALKMARQYFIEIGEADGGATGNRTRFVARRQAYHGNTIGAMGVSSNLPRKKPYANLQLPGCSWVSPAYAYQYSHWRQGETEDEFSARLVQELEQHFLDLGPQTVVAFIAEPLVGATSGCTPAPRGYFQGVRKVCDKYGILLILDEVMCGTGRTGTMFAFEQEGIVPDLVTMGKGLGGGYCPIAAVLMHKKVIDGLRKGSSSFNHGHTYQAHPVSCAAAVAVQKVLKRDGLIENCRTMGTVLHAMLVDTFSSCKYVGDIRGRGLFWGIEFVQDKANREPFEARITFGPRFQHMAFEHGVAVYPGAGTVDGTKGDHAIIAPPYNITHQELQLMVDVLKQVYQKLEHEVDHPPANQKMPARPF